MEKADKNISPHGEYSFQAKMMVAGHHVFKVFDTLDEAKIWKNLQRTDSSPDLDGKHIFETQANKRTARN